MKLRGRYRLLVKGDIDKFRVGYSTRIIGHLFQRLLTGDDAHQQVEPGIEVRELNDDDEIITVPPEGA